ncbi:MAG TPA: ATP synthase subunit I [Thermodesulfobacteriota bacterium]|nr:ATP synthase subunit I [Thermodesulfobacteriota bacterium]
MEALKEATKKKFIASEKRALIILFFLAAASLFFESKKIFFGVLIGGGLSLINIVILSKIGEKVFQQSNPRKTPVVITYIIKIIILFGALFFLVSHEVVSIFAFIVSFSIILLIVGFESIFSSQKTNNH